jgi:hypothetical protein
MSIGGSQVILILITSRLNKTSTRKNKQIILLKTSQDMNDNLHYIFNDEPLKFSIYDIT